MKIFRLEQIPENYQGDEYTSCELQDYELQPLKDIGIEEIRYWYAQGSYCGAGDMLLLKDGKWHLADLSHCSCYGPTEDINETFLTGTRKYDNPEAILENCSEGAKTDIIGLVQMV